MNVLQERRILLTKNYKIREIKWISINDIGFLLSKKKPDLWICETAQSGYPDWIMCPYLYF